MGTIPEVILEVALLVLAVGSFAWWCRHYAVRFDLSVRSPFAPA